MKARSVQFKLLITFIFAILTIAVFVGGFSIYEVDKYIQNHTKDFIDTTCSNEASQINNIFGNIENSVRIMESYVLSLFERTSDIEDPDNQNEILQLSGEMFADVADNTVGAVAYYLRFNPEISDSTTGMFYTKMNDEYVSLEPTDISLYDKDDVEHVGWFWQPYEAGCPIWLDPYFNQNNGILMVSFVIPLYFDGGFVGVVGMDFDYTLLTEKVHAIKIYENGFAHLELNGAVIHSGNETSDGEDLHETREKYLESSQNLRNGMSLVLFASYDDIKQIRYEIAYKILLSVILVALAFSIIVFLVVKKVVKPLKDLTDASIKLSSGDYEVKIERSGTYEIDQLSVAFENMLVNLKEHKKLQHLLAYRDSLTKLRNMNSYRDWVIDFDKKIEAKNVSFGVIVLDLNYLKNTNDTYGHNVGNKLIVMAAEIISRTFKRSPIFRIGGDEFLVILQDQELKDRDILLSKFEEICENSFAEDDNVKIPISIAKGFSLFDPSTDTQFSDVFKRADNEMYKDKQRMKTASV